MSVINKYQLVKNKPYAAENANFPQQEPFLFFLEIVISI